MDNFRKSHIEELNSKAESVNISAFIPTYRANRDEENRIGVKNAIKEIQQKLEEKGWDEEKIDDMMRSFHELMEKENFWGRQSDGLAIFANSSYFEFFTVPVHFKAFTYIGSDFYIKPMVNLFNSGDVAHLMTVSPNGIRLLSFTDYAVTEHDISEEFPQNLEESHWHVDREATLQSHGSKSSMFHGHGGNKDSREEDIKRFFRDVNTGLENFFKGTKRTLYLAGVTETVHIFKDTFKYDHIAEDYVSGNHDETSALELHERVMMIREKEQNTALEESIEKVHDQLHTDRAETSISQIIKAGHEGKIDTLFIRNDRSEWGYFNKEKYKVEQSNEKSNGQIDLLNTAATMTILNGGKVVLLEEEQIPEDIQSNAIAYFRH